MNFDDHTADTKSRMTLWASQYGFTSETDDPTDMRFVFNSEDPEARNYIRELMGDLGGVETASTSPIPGSHGWKLAVWHPLLQYFVVNLGGTIVVSMPFLGLHNAQIQPGEPAADEILGEEIFTPPYRHKDAVEVLGRHEHEIEEEILTLFKKQHDLCRRAHIKAV